MAGRKSKRFGPFQKQMLVGEFQNVNVVRAQPDGFVLTFNEPVDVASAGNAENWDAVQYICAYNDQHNATEKEMPDEFGPPIEAVGALAAGVNLESAICNLKSSEAWS
ncbi:MAG: hypothetical protein AAB466_13935 [Verrucomicrobiota bacterium]